MAGAQHNPPQVGGRAEVHLHPLWNTWVFDDDAVVTVLRAFGLQLGFRHKCGNFFLERGQRLAASLFHLGIKRGEFFVKFRNARGEIGLLFV